MAARDDLLGKITDRYLATVVCADETMADTALGLDEPQPVFCPQFRPQAAAEDPEVVRVAMYRVPQTALGRA